MRLLNEMEQEFCRRILDGKNTYNVIPNLLDSDLPGMIVTVNRMSKRAWVEFSESYAKEDALDSESNFIDIVNDITLRIITLCHLIALLDKEGYIMTYRKSTMGEGQVTFGQGIHGRRIKHSISDQVACDLLVKYIVNVIVVTPEFEFFCNNGFVGREEVRFRQSEALASHSLKIAESSLSEAKTSKNLARWAIGVSIATSLASILIPVLFDNGPKSVKVENFDPLYMRMDRLQHELHLSNSRLDSLARPKSMVVQRNNDSASKTHSSPKKTQPKKR